MYECGTHTQRLSFQSTAVAMGKATALYQQNTRMSVCEIRSRDLNF